MALAINSLPVPFSPNIRMFASVGAIFSILKKIFFITSDSPIISLPITGATEEEIFPDVFPFVFKVAFMVSTSFSLCHGFTTKSAAPSFKDRTARSISP